VDVASYEDSPRPLPGLLSTRRAHGETEQARDIVQEVMVRAFTRWRRISRSTTRRYLRRMVTNEWTRAAPLVGPHDHVLPDEQLHNLAGDARTR